MKISGFTVKYIILLFAQILLGNFFNLSQYLMISILPVMILVLPVNKGSIATMVIAFLSGLAVDFFCDGQLGLNAAALLPLAFMRRPLIRFVFGNELFSREENISPRRQGWEKLAFGILLSSAIFLLIYILIDSAGTRAAWVDIVKFLSSLILSSAVSLLTADFLCTETESRWK